VKTTGVPILLAAHTLLSKTHKQLLARLPRRTTFLLIRLLAQTTFLLIRLLAQTTFLLIRLLAQTTFLLIRLLAQTKLASSANFCFPSGAGFA
jgi:hypothetical protein